jgi:hypothetical protein
MSQEGSAGGFEQASADAARLASELAEIRKQLTELREQNAKFLATDPVTGKGPAAASAAKDSATQQPLAKTIGATAKAGQAAPGAKDKDAQSKSPAKEPQMAAAGRTGASSSSTPPASAPAAGSNPATEQPPATEEPDSGKKRWWKKQKPDEKDSGF